MSEVAVKFVGDEADLWRALQKVIAGGVRMEAGLDAIKKRGDAVDVSLQRFAERTKAANATPLERYQAAVGRLDQALAKNLLTQGEHARAIAAEKTALDESQAALGKVASKSDAADKQLRQLAERTKTLTATPLERFQAAVQQLGQAQQRGLLTHEQYAAAVARERQTLDAATAASQRLSQQSQGTTAAGVQSIQALAGRGYQLLTQLAHTARQSLEELNQQYDEVAAKTRGAEGSLAELAQLAGTPQEFARLTGAARATHREGGARSLDAAAKLVFSLESAGALRERELFSQLGSTGLVSDPAAMAKAAATLVTSMGEQETGGFRALVSKSFGAAKYSPARAEQVLEAAARSGATARELGISDEEILAGTAVMSSAKGSAEEAGTRMAALLRAVAKQREFQGLNLDQSLQAIASKQLDTAELQDFLGAAEAVETFQVLRDNLATFRSATSDIRASQQQDLVGAKLRLPASDPGLAAARQARLGEARQDTALERGADLANLLKAVDHERRALIEQAFPNRGQRLVRLGFETVGRTAGRLLLGDEAVLRDRLNNNQIADPELKRQIRQTLAASPSFPGKAPRTAERARQDAAGARPAPAAGGSAPQAIDTRRLDQAAVEHQRAAQAVAQAAQRLEAALRPGPPAANVRAGWTGPARREAAAETE